MRAEFDRVTRRIMLTGLALALVVSAAAPLLGDQGVEAARKGKRAKSSGDVQAEAIQTFSNGGAIVISDGTTTQSPLTVSGFETPIADVDVTLNNLTISGSNAGDIDILLVGPAGQTAVILSDVGSTASDVTLTFDDEAANQVSSTGPLSTGPFQPTNFQSAGDSWGPPAPPTPSSGSELGVFNGTDANGAWNLFVDDDTSNSSTGSIAGGWSMRITTANGVPSAGADSFQATAGKPLTVPADGVLGNDADPDDDSLTAILAGQPRQGSLTLRADGGFTYRPKKKAKGSDSFTYLAEDSDGLNALATVDIKIKKKKKKGKK
jgi:subtilisin-like proprotein convertase family protein